MEIDPPQTIQARIAAGVATLEEWAVAPGTNENTLAFVSSKVETPSVAMERARSLSRSIGAGAGRSRGGSLAPSEGEDGYANGNNTQFGHVSPRANADRPLSVSMMAASSSSLSPSSSSEAAVSEMMRSHSNASRSRSSSFAGQGSPSRPVLRRPAGRGGLISSDDSYRLSSNDDDDDDDDSDASSDLSSASPSPGVPPVAAAMARQYRESHSTSALSSSSASSQSQSRLSATENPALATSQMSWLAGPSSQSQTEPHSHSRVSSMASTAMMSWAGPSPHTPRASNGSQVVDRRWMADGQGEGTSSRAQSSITTPPGYVGPQRPKLRLSIPNSETAAIPSVAPPVASIPVPIEVVNASAAAGVASSIAVPISHQPAPTSNAMPIPREVPIIHGQTPQAQPQALVQAQSQPSRANWQSAGLSATERFSLLSSMLVARCKKITQTISFLDGAFKLGSSISSSVAPTFHGIGPDGMPIISLKVDKSGRAPSTSTSPISGSADKAAKDLQKAVDEQRYLLRCIMAELSTFSTFPAM